MKVGVIGRGFVGEALYQSFTKRGIEVLSYDKYKNIGSIKDVIESEYLFLCLPTRYIDGYGYDLGAFHEVIRELKRLGFYKTIIIKSTVEPGTTRRLSEQYDLGHMILHNPEFLTARTANEDFENQKHIVIGSLQTIEPDLYLTQGLSKFYNDFYPKAEISICSAEESECMKLVANCFYATKVQLFNEFYFLTQKVGADYSVVKDLVVKNGWIAPTHLQVPGPDGQYSYGGGCFIKDTKALNNFMKNLGIPHEVLSACVSERDKMRKD